MTTMTNPQPIDEIRDVKSQYVSYGQKTSISCKTEGNGAAKKTDDDNLLSKINSYLKESDLPAYVSDEECLRVVGGGCTSLPTNKSALPSSEKLLDSIEANILRKDADFYCLNIELNGELLEITLPIVLAEENFVIGQSVQIKAIEDCEGFKKLRISAAKIKYDKVKQTLLKEIEDFINS